MLKQFYRRPEDDNMDTGLAYDHSSIMHYKFTAFGKNISMSTILLRDKNSTEEPTPYSYITDLDVLKTKEMYNCPDSKYSSLLSATSPGHMSIPGLY